jgi:hypothetical protein
MVYFTEKPGGCDYHFAIKRVYSFNYQDSKQKEINYLEEWKLFCPWQRRKVLLQQKDDVMLILGWKHFKHVYYPEQ